MAKKTTLKRREQRRRQLDSSRESEINMATNMYIIDDTVVYTTLSTSETKPKLSPSKAKCNGQCNTPKKEEEIMRDPIQDQREYLIYRLSDAYLAKVEALRHQFNLIDQPRPANAAEWLKRIQDGKFVWRADVVNSLTDSDFWDYRRLSGYCEYIKWRDPAVVADKDGFNLALEALRPINQATRDQISIMSPEVGLTALNTFEAWTYTAPATTPTT